MIKYYYESDDSIVSSITYCLMLIIACSNPRVQLESFADNEINLLNVIADLHNHDGDFSKV